MADFGEKQNAKLAQKYQVKTKTYDYPQYRLFLRSKGLEAPFGAYYFCEVNAKPLLSN